jgi:hypothetical protein
LQTAEDMGKETEFLEFHTDRVTMWRNRNCLLKLSLNSKQTEVFKGISADVFREIIKYA